MIYIPVGFLCYSVFILRPRYPRYQAILLLSRLSFSLSVSYVYNTQDLLAQFAYVSFHVWLSSNTDKHAEIINEHTAFFSRLYFCSNTTVTQHSYGPKWSSNICQVLKNSVASGEEFYLAQVANFKSPFRHKYQIYFFAS